MRKNSSDAILFKHNLYSEDYILEYYENINLEEFRKFNGRLVSSRNGNAPIEKFVEDNYSKIVIKEPYGDLENKKLAINSIIINVLVALDDQKVVAIPRQKNLYSIPQMYGLSHIRYSYIIVFLDRLIELEYIDQQMGFWDKDVGEGKLTRIWATLKLMEEMNYYYSNSTALILPFETSKDSYSKIFTYSNHDRIIKPYNTPILLKDASKKLINYRPTSKIYKRKRFLEDYNELVKESLILHPYNTQIQLTIRTQYNTTPLLVQNQANSLLYNRLQGRLHSVFNRSKFFLGGRFYGAEHQGMNEEERSKITFDGKPTKELDYANLHLQMIYNICGYQLEGDAYSILGEKYRPLIKTIGLISINAESRNETIQAFSNKLKKDSKLYHLYLESRLEIPQLLEIFISGHPKISQYLSSGIGLRLQYMDSKIAEKIMKYFTRKGVLVAPIHDSFIVAEKYMDELEEVMKEAYFENMGFKIRVK